MRRQHRCDVSRPIASVLLAAALASSASGQVIFIDPCGITIPAQTHGQLTVWVCVEGAILEGITSAQFRIAGLPTGWTATVSPVGGVASVGELFGDGVNAVLAACDDGTPVPGGRYLGLFQVDVLATDDTKDVVLAVTGKDPSDPPFQCALVTLCDEPAFTKVCVGNHGAIVNPESLGCGLPTEAWTWSRVKAIYR